MPKTVNQKGFTSLAGSRAKQKRKPIQPSGQRKKVDLRANAAVSEALPRRYTAHQRASLLRLQNNLIDLAREAKQVWDDICQAYKP